MQRTVFLSYRRDDSEGEAGRLYDDLTRAYGDDSVFMDVSAIQPGVDFRKAIEENVGDCGVLLAMIGPTWATITDASGARRLDHPDDFVRLEIAAALKRNVAVIPVLVHDAKMPRPDQLPEDLKDLAFRNSVEITHARWTSDVALLVNALGPYVVTSRAESSEPVHATVSVQLPAPRAVKAELAAAPKKSKLPLMAAAAAVLLAVLGGVSWLLHGRGEPAATPAVKSVDAASTGPASSSSPISGLWVNPEPGSGNSIVRLLIQVTGQSVTMQAWGNCLPEACPWGTQATTLNGDEASASWSWRGKDGQIRRVAALTASPVNGKLSVKIDNTYDGGAPKSLHFEFVPASQAGNTP